MAETGLVIEQTKDELQQIMGHIANGDNFLLSGGAGSGKTYSLVQVIKQVIADNPISKVACMTYTNAAVKEIEERVNHKNLNVSTIHDFLWDNIKHFQKELKLAIVALANDEDAIGWLGGKFEIDYRVVDSARVEHVADTEDQGCGEDCQRPPQAYRKCRIGLHEQRQGYERY